MPALRPQELPFFLGARLLPLPLRFLCAPRLVSFFLSFLSRLLSCCFFLSLSCAQVFLIRHAESRNNALFQSLRNSLLNEAAEHSVSGETFFFFLVFLLVRSSSVSLSFLLWLVRQAGVQTEPSLLCQTLFFLRSRRWPAFFSFHFLVIRRRTDVSGRGVEDFLEKEKSDTPQVSACSNTEEK